MARTPTREPNPDPFTAIPQQPENVDQRRDSQGMIHLRLRIEPQGFAKKIADWLHYDYAQKLELDEYGTFYYSRVDGNATLHDIVEDMAREYADWNRKQVEEAVILFTKKLMTMNMLALRVPQPGEQV